MKKQLNCDNTEEITAILKCISEIKEEAEWNIECGYEDELTKLVVRYMPIIETELYKFL